MAKTRMKLFWNYPWWGDSWPICWFGQVHRPLHHLHTDFRRWQCWQPYCMENSFPALFVLLRRSILDLRPETLRYSEFLYHPLRLHTRKILKNGIITDKFIKTKYTHVHDEHKTICLWFFCWTCNWHRFVDKQIELNHRTFHGTNIGQTGLPGLKWSPEELDEISISSKILLSSYPRSNH